MEDMNMKNKEQLEEKKDNELVAIVNQSGVELGVEKVLQKNISLIPHTIEVERIKASAGFYVSNKEDLMKLDNKGKLKMLYGILKEAMVGCEAGTDYDILVFKGEPTVCRNKNGWFKIIDLIKPAEIIRFVSNVITTDDKYTWKPVTEYLEHEMIGERYQDFAHIEGAYAYIKLANGFEKTVFLNKDDLKKLKDISPSGNTAFSPWNSNSVRMCETKAIKDLAKKLFTLFSGRTNPRMVQAIESDEKVVKKIDEKGHIIHEEAIYEEAPTKQVEPADFETKKEVKLSEI
jgi:hypothetical protein